MMHLRNVRLLNLQDRKEQTVNKIQLERFIFLYDLGHFVSSTSAYLYFQKNFPNSQSYKCQFIDSEVKEASGLCFQNLFLLLLH